MKGFFIGVGVGAVVFSVGLGGLITLTDYGVDQSKTVLKDAVVEAERHRAESQARIDAEPLSYGKSMTRGELASMESQAQIDQRAAHKAANERTVEQYQEEIEALEARVAALHEEQAAKIQADLAKE